MEIKMRLSVLVLIAAACFLPAQEILHTTPPKVIHRVDLEYTDEALDAKLQGSAVLSTVVGTDGAPGEIKVVRGLGNGLDEKAVECLRQWRFAPALNHAERVPAKVTVEMSFRLPQSSARPK
jgi:TonB family protein